MIDNHLTDLLAPYVLGTLDRAAAKRVADHLAICTICQAHAQALREHLLDDAVSHPQLIPRPHVKHRLMARIQTMTPAPTRHMVRYARFKVALGMTSLSLAFLGAFLFLYTLNQNGLNAAGIQTPISAAATQTGLDSFVHAPGTTAHKLADQGYAPGAQATLYIQKGDSRIGLVVDQLPPAPHGHIYQLWVAVGEAQISLGTFEPHSGHVALIAPAPDLIDTYTDAMVTIEPLGGSTKPSAKIVWALGL